MGYELTALAGGSEAIAAAAEAVRSSPARLRQGFLLLPVTDEVFDQLGRGGERPYGEMFWFLSGGIAEVAARASSVSPVAYLEAELSGGTGTQASVVWEAGEVVFGPVKTDFRPTDAPRRRGIRGLALRLRGGGEPAREDWPFNAALRCLGVETGAADDMFDAVDLGRHRHTDEWAAEADSDPASTTST